MPVALAQFVEQLELVGIDLEDCPAPDGVGEDVEGWARHLIEAGRLSVYQAQALLQGKGRSLLLGDYRIVDRLGAGGMGQVFRAVHRRMDRIVALKVLPAAQMNSPDAVKRFQREMRAVAKLSHCNIVQAYDAGEQRGISYLVMEYVEGADLSSLVKQQGPLAWEEAVRFTLQAASGLAYAHQEGVIHRDIKPANLLVDKRGHVKVLDLGLARIDDADDALTGTEQVMGTVDYMSPEQAMGTRHADARADVYSLGCTLWYLLTGARLYEGDSAIARVLKHREAPLPSLREKRPEIPAEVEHVWRRMIAKRPQERFPTMLEVISAFEGATGFVLPSSPSLTRDDLRVNSPLPETPSASKTDLTERTRGLDEQDDPRSTPTAAFLASDWETDPKSQLTLQPIETEVRGSLPRPRPSIRPTSNARGTRWPTVLWTIGGGLGAIGLCVLFWIRGYNVGSHRLAHVEPDETGSSAMTGESPAGAVPAAAMPMVSPVPSPVNAPLPPDDRSVALWALGRGASLELAEDDGVHTVRTVADLPAESFWISGITFDGDLTDDDDVERFANLIELDAVRWIRSPRLTDAGIRRLPLDGTIAFLTLMNTNVGDAGLDHLAAMESLVDLRLMGSPVGDIGARTLARSRSILHLDLSRTAIGDDGLQALQNLRRLTTLNVSQTRVSEAGVNAFHTVRPEVHLSFTRDGVQHFFPPHAPTAVSAVAKPTLPAVAPPTPAAVPTPPAKPPAVGSPAPVKAPSPSPATPGVSLGGWKEIGTSGQWQLVNGEFRLTGNRSGWLASPDEYEHFELELEYRLSPGANSGILLRTPRTTPASATNCLRIQLIEDGAYRQSNRSPLQRSGALFQLVEPAVPLESSPDVWHPLRVRVAGGMVSVWQHGGTPVMHAHLPELKQADQAWLRRERGHIGFMAAGEPVAFRNVRVMPLPPPPEGPPDRPGPMIPGKQPPRPPLKGPMPGKAPPRN